MAIISFFRSVPAETTRGELEFLRKPAQIACRLKQHRYDTVKVETYSQQY
jgi:hypothetical protein